MPLMFRYYFRALLMPRQMLDYFSATAPALSL